MKKIIYSFLTPDVIKGVSSLLDIGATGVKFKKPGGFHEDGLALRSDWDSVGVDIWEAMDEYRRTNYTKRRKPGKQGSFRSC